MDIHSENIKIINSIENQKHGHLTKRERLIIYSFTQLEERPQVSDHTLLVNESMLIYVIMENIRKMSCRIEEYMEYSRNSSKVSTVTCRNHHLSLTMIEVINVPYEWFLYNPTVCWVYFTKSAIISKQ